MRIDQIDEEILLALKDSPRKLKEIGLLVKSPRIAKRRIEKLLKYGFVRRISQGIYGLDSKGKDYIKRRTLSDEMLSIGQDLWDKVSAFIIDKVPSEAYQAVIRLILSCMKAKQSEIFDHFSGAWPGVILAGMPKTLKSPLGELICEMTGLDPEKQKYVLHMTTKGELGGRSHQVKGGQWTFKPSRWFNEPFVILDELDKILKKDTTNTALYLAHGDRTFRIGEQIITNHCVPFITLNTHTETVSETVQKIKAVVGREYIKRCITVNVDYLAPYLEDIAIRARKVFKAIPRLNLKAFPVKKTELTDQEFELTCKFLKEATRPDKGEFFDERSVEILILGRYALSKNRDIIGTIYQTCWDRLLCLETLGVTKEGWRESFRKKWKEYISIEQPKVLEQLEKEDKREKERKKKIERTREEIVRQKAEKIEESLLFTGKRAALEAKLRELRDEFPRKKRWENQCFPLREQIKRLIEKIKGVRNFQELEICQQVLPGIEREHEKLLGYIKKTEDGEQRLREEEKHEQDKFKREKSRVKEQCQALKGTFRTYAKLTGGMAENYNQQNERYLESLFYRIEEAKDIDTLTSISSVIEKDIKEVNGWIEKKEAEKERKKREEEGKRERMKKRQEQNKKLKVIQNKKNQISEKWRKDIFESRYLTSQEKAELDILQSYQKKKKAPVSDITSFLKERKLIFKVNISYHLANGQTVLNAFNNSYYKRFGELLPYEVYWAIDNQVYPLNYFNTWDKALILIQIRIDRIKNIAIQNRKNKLSQERHRLDKEEKILKALHNLDKMIGEEVGEVAKRIRKKV